MVLERTFSGPGAIHLDVSELAIYRSLSSQMMYGKSRTVMRGLKTQFPAFATIWLYDLASEPFKLP